MAEQEVIETEGAEEVKEQPKETPKPTRADYDRIQAEKARQSGWKDFDEYVAEGGDPEKWKTADAFNIYGEMLGTVRRKEAEFNQRLEGVQKLSEAQLKAQREQLLAEREALIEEGGKSKEVRALDKQLEQLQQPVIPQSIPILDQWNADNPWIMEKTPKAVYARAVWDELKSQMPIPQALEKLEEEIKKQFPSQSKGSGKIPETERGAGPKGFNKQTTRAVTMDSLTSEEAYIWKHSASMWNNDQKAFLQSVADTRKAAQGSK